MRDHVTNALGREIFIDPSDGRASRLLATHGDFNPGSLRLWSVVVGSHAWGTLVDVGANYGEMLVGIEIPPDTRVVAFEPLDHIADLLEKTLSRAGLDVTVERCAVSDSVGTARFVEDVSWSGKSSLVHAHPKNPTRVEEVRTTTLSAFFDDPHPGSLCVKIDVEGHELAVLRGAADLLERATVCALMIEVLHLSVSDIAALASEWQMYALDTRLGTLVRVPSSPELATAFVSSRWCYPQDVVLVPRGKPVPWRDDPMVDRGDAETAEHGIAAITSREEAIEAAQRDVAAARHESAASRAEIEGIRSDAERATRAARKRERHARRRAAEAESSLAAITTSRSWRLLQLFRRRPAGQARSSRAMR